MAKKNVALLTGGYSREYDISVKSGKVIASHINRAIFDVFVIEVGKEHWNYLHTDGNVYAINLNDFSLTLSEQKVLFDAAFIGIHGTPGEDGKIQGYLDMVGVPYSTCGRTTSALTFNKYLSNEVVAGFGVNTARTVYLHKRDLIDGPDLISKIGLPCFVKPNSNGSSIGITKVKQAEEILPAIKTAFEVDDEVLVQEFIPGTEITCGIYEKNGRMIILPLTMIESHNEWFDYEAKYTDGMADEISPAPIDESLAEECRQISAMLYRKLNCRGIVRFDYILNPTPEPGKSGFLFLEVNTVPGLSEASIVPRQAASIGISLEQLFTDVLNETIQSYKLAY